MRNQDRYKTAQERAEAFRKYCGKMHDRPGGSCGKQERCSICSLKWLDLEAEEEPLQPCYMCGSHRITSYKADVGYSLICRDCGYCAGTADTREEIEVKHNRVAKKCMEVKK